MKQVTHDVDSRDEVIHIEKRVISNFKGDRVAGQAMVTTVLTT